MDLRIAVFYINPNGAKKKVYYFVDEIIRRVKFAFSLNISKIV